MSQIAFYEKEPHPFFAERMFPVDDIEANRLAEEVLANPPEVGYLTVSNALQWRLQYRRAIERAGYDRRHCASEVTTCLRR